MARGRFGEIAKRKVDAFRERKGISVTPTQPQAIDIAQTVPNAEESTVPALPDGSLPPLESAAWFTRSAIVHPPLLVKGLLHQQCKMVLAGGSKTFKSWTLIDLGLSIAAGAKWWNHFDCVQNTVVYINFELFRSFLMERVLDICDAKKIAPPPNFLVWNLREVCYDLETVSRVLQERADELKTRIGCIIVDPIYKALNGLDENAASEMTILMSKIEQLSAKTRSAVVFGAHFSKGAQAQKESKDRISGSGVFGRDPDCILTMTKHMVKGSYAVEFDLRYLPSPGEFVVSWEKPLMFKDEGKNPDDLWVPGKREKENEDPLNDADVLSVLVHSGMQDGMWKEQVKKKFGRAGNAYYEAKKRLIEQKLVIKHGFKYLPVNFALQASEQQED